MKFWIPWTIAAVTTASALVFFLVGLSDGTVASFNMGIWISILAALGVVLAGSYWLKTIGRPRLGTLLLMVLVVPVVISVLFLLVFVVSGTQWI